MPNSRGEQIRASTNFTEEEQIAHRSTTNVFFGRPEEGPPDVRASLDRCDGHSETESPSPLTRATARAKATKRRPTLDLSSTSSPDVPSKDHPNQSVSNDQRRRDSEPAVGAEQRTRQTKVTAKRPRIVSQGPTTSTDSPKDGLRRISSTDPRTIGQPIAKCDAQSVPTNTDKQVPINERGSKRKSSFQTRSSIDHHQIQSESALNSSIGLDLHQEKTCPTTVDTTELSVSGISADVKVGDEMNYPIFEKYAKQVKNVRRTILEKMKDSLTKTDERLSSIYLMQLKSRPRFCKIGRTEALDKRLSEIKNHVGGEMVEIFSFRMTCANRVEKLIHLELQEERRQFHCQKCSAVHDEWFELGKEGIKRTKTVVERWEKWVAKRPYNGKRLRWRERLRIDLLGLSQKNRDSLWPWDSFLEYPTKKLFVHSLQSWIFDSRVVDEPNCSRYDSLCEHWQSNILLGLAYYLFSCVLFAAFKILLCDYRETTTFALMNAAFLGGFSILYAA